MLRKWSEEDLGLHSSMFLEASGIEGGLYRIAQEVNEQSLCCGEGERCGEFSAAPARG